MPTNAQQMPVINKKSPPGSERPSKNKSSALCFYVFGGIKTAKSLPTYADLEALKLCRCSVSCGHTAPRAARCPFPFTIAVLSVAAHPMFPSHCDRRQLNVAPSIRCGGTQVDHKAPVADRSRRDAVYWYFVRFFTVVFIRRWKRNGRLGGSVLTTPWGTVPLEIDVKPSRRQGAEAGGSEDGNKTKASREGASRCRPRCLQPLVYCCCSTTAVPLGSGGRALRVTKTLPLNCSCPFHLRINSSTA